MQLSLTLWNIPPQSYSTEEDGGSSMRKVSSWSGPHDTRRRRPSCSTCESSTDRSAFSFRLLPRVLAKISIALLAVAAVVDLTSQSNKSFLLRASSDGTRQALGSAAIKSVTETLSPILPFTGGVDLRKEVSSSPLETVQSITRQVWEAFSPSHQLSTASSDLITYGSRGDDSLFKSHIAHETALSSSECFVSRDEIAQLTLDDVSQLLYYAAECNRQSFDESRFVGRQLPRVRKILDQMRKAVQKSRGQGVSLSVRSGNGPRAKGSPGSADTLMFAAAVRVFGEWRVLRQVPDGYKGYAVGMNLGYKDIVQNIAKVELAAHGWIDTMEPSTKNGIVRSPTVGELLQYEASTGVHPNLPRLKDRTAAMGLLWVRRQLQYQNLVYENSSSGRFRTATEAVAAAYKTVYNQYHGWAVQKLFTYSFQPAPSVEIIFRHMDPHKLKHLREGAAIPSKKTEWRKVSNSEVEEEKNPLVLWFKKLEQELQDNPLLCWFKKVGDDSRKLFEELRHKLVPDTRGQDDEFGEEGSVMEDYITTEMTKNAHEHIKAFLQVANPMVSNLEQIFDQLNMNDPTRV